MNRREKRPVAQKIERPPGTNHLALPVIGRGVGASGVPNGPDRWGGSEDSDISSSEPYGSPHTNKRGFTLLEVLISVAILAVLFTLVYGAFNATYRVSEQLDKEAEAYRLARIGFYHLSRDLSMVYPQVRQQTAAPPPPPAASGGSTVAPVFKGGDGTKMIDGIDYPNDSIQFTSVSHGRTLLNAPESDRMVVSYFLDAERLIREGTPAGGKGVRNEVGENVLGLQLRYYDGRAKTWVDQWDLALRNGLPVAVEVELILRKGGKEGRRFKTTVDIPVAGRQP